MGCTRSTSVARLLPRPTPSQPQQRYHNKTAENFGMAASQRMQLVWSASHHVCAAAAVGVHWLTPRCTLAGQKQWNVWAQNSGKSVSASAASQTACSLWRGHQTLCHSRAVPKRQSLRQENPTLSVFASATLRTATARWRGHPAPRGSSRKVHSRTETCKEILKRVLPHLWHHGQQGWLEDAIGQLTVATVSDSVSFFKISAVWPDQDGMHAQYQCRTVAAGACSASPTATASQPKTSEKFGLPAKHGMPLTWFAAHHVGAAESVWVSWLTLRRSCSLQDLWSSREHNSGQSVSASAASWATRRT